MSDNLGRIFSYQDEENDINFFEDLGAASPPRSPERINNGQFESFQNKKKSQEKVQVPPKIITNKFLLSDQHKITLTKKLPKGFVLLKKPDLPQNTKPFKGQIEYIPVKKQPKIASEKLLQKLPISIRGTLLSKKQNQKKSQKPGLRLSSSQLPEGKSKQTQKVKGILQKFRKHPKYSQLSQQLGKLGFLQGFTEIQSQIKKNIHTIDSFKDRCMYILNETKKATFAEATIEVINEMIDEFMFQVQQAKKMEFESNLMSIQKSIDKITREITDIKESGNWYLRKKKRTEKNFDERQIMYIADLVRELPPAYLVGVWQIVQEKPFLESNQKELSINFSQLKTKKIREIQSYVKRKHNTYLRSRERKAQKLRRKKEQKQAQLKKQLINKGKTSQNDKKETKQARIQQVKSQKGLKGRSDEQKDMNEEKQQIADQPKHCINKQQSGGLFLMGEVDQYRKDDYLDDYFMSEEKNKQMEEEKSVKSPSSQQPEQKSLQQPKLENQMDEQKEKSLEFELQLDQPGLHVPSSYDGNSSDSSMITDDEDSQF